jgi:hypothetical protein
MDWEENLGVVEKAVEEGICVTGTVGSVREVDLSSQMER